MNINGNKISILGAVRSGVSAAKLALKNGAIPFVSDLSDNDEVKHNCDLLQRDGIEYEIGNHSSRVFDCDLIVTSPGVPSNSAVLVTALDKGIKVVSEIEFASWFCKGEIIAITGTNGKTTTATLCSHVINHAGMKCYLAGNIGLPFSEIAMSVKPDEYVSLEVSSFQLDFIDQFKPKYSVILNITPDHLDRYDNRFDRYIKSKMRIVQNQANDDIFIYNGDDSNIPIGYIQNETRIFGFSIDKNLSNGCFLDDEWIVFSKQNFITDVCKIEDMSLKGEHNLMNSMAVVNIAMNIGIQPESIKNAFQSFKGVEHRLEFVREINGIKFINDSKATNVDSVWYALRSFKEPIYLILGGKDKGNDYSKLRNEVKKRVKKIYAIGSSAEKVFDYFNGIVNTEIVNSFETAVSKGLKDANSGSIFLLSPACASFDMFKNYEDRGFQFKKIVNEIE
jgi:UDP-N-acetylmuramoylalanine--D-glutamate ligase